ncbi:helix-turn-helix domain-containing protein [Spirulina subsalsa]|uniref:helix-turn-helix domain-containing protein n=1 Tax=Spirulina subsalsa TaxID=54311 RepID=UPI0013DFBAC4
MCGDVRLLDLLFEQPLVNIRFIEKNLGCAYVTANKLVDQFQELGLLKEITGWQRNRLYRYEPYLALFDNY